MTHDELLTKVSLEETDGRATSGQRALALRAVVELHHPEEVWFVDCCMACRNEEGLYKVKYPCSTIKAIEAALS